MRNALLLMTVTIGSLSASPVALDVTPTATVRGNVVLVSDVAQIVSGTDPGLLKVELARTPNPGKVLRLTRARIRGTLAAHGFDARAVRVRGARAAVVTPATTRLDPAALRSLATRFLTEELASRYDLAAPVRVSAPEEPWLVPVGRERSALHVRWLVQPGDAAPRRAHLEVVVTLDGEERAVRTLLARIKLPAETTQVPQPAARPAAAQPTPTTPPASPISTTPPSPTPEPLAVTAGQRVLTRVKVGALTVTSEGVVTVDASLGALVGVQVSSGPIREGRVVAPGVVELTTVRVAQ